MLQNDFFEQRYMILNGIRCNHSWSRQNLPKNQSVQNFFAGYMIAKYIKKGSFLKHVRAIFHGCKNGNFQVKNSDIFLIFA